MVLIGPNSTAGAIFHHSVQNFFALQRPLCTDPDPGPMQTTITTSESALPFFTIS